MAEQEQVKCVCGCGQFRDSLDNRGRPRKFIRGHHRRGKGLFGKDNGMYGVHRYGEDAPGYGIPRSGEKNPNWKGGVVGRKYYCKDCGKRITYFAMKRNGRCRGCAYIKMRGEGSPHWKGGITPLAAFIRHLPEYFQWRNDIYKRDKYTCQECKVNRNLRAHHIKPFKKLLQEFLQEYNQFSPVEDKETLLRLAMEWQPFWDRDNGSLLCEKCHNLMEAKCYGRSR